MNDGEDEKKSIHGDAAASLSRKSTIRQCFDYGHIWRKVRVYCTNSTEPQS